MGNNVVYASDLLLYSNGKAIKVFIKEHVYAALVVNKKIYVKFVHLTYSLVYQWK